MKKEAHYFYLSCRGKEKGEFEHLLNYPLGTLVHWTLIVGDSDYQLTTNNNFTVGK